MTNEQAGKILSRLVQVPYMLEESKDVINLAIQWGKNEQKRLEMINKIRNRLYTLDQRSELFFQLEIQLRMLEECEVS